MYYERTQTGTWKPNNAKQVLFNKSTHPIESVPPEFWNADRMPATDNPEYDSATHKLVGPQGIGEMVGYKKEPLTMDELYDRYKSSVPYEVTKRQATEYLLDAGMYHDIMAQIESMGEKALLIWGAVPTIERNHDLVLALGLPENQLDNMFINANEL